MRSRLGSFNLVLLSLYFFPLWGREATRALISRYHGLDDRAQVVAASYFGGFADLGWNGLVLTSYVLSGVKLVIAAAFVAYIIEFARACVTRRDADRDTIDVVLILAVVGVLMGLLPALALGDPAMIRLQATHVLMIAGAVTVIVIERQLAPEPEGVTAAASAGEDEILDLPMSAIVLDPPPVAALARIPESHPL